MKYVVIPLIISERKTKLWGLRIVITMRYTGLNGQFLPYKAIACSAANTARNLTQHTEQAADWAGIDYTKPDLRPGGIPSGRLDSVEPDCGQGAPHT